LHSPQQMSVARNGAKNAAAPAGALESPFRGHTFKRHRPANRSKARGEPQAGLRQISLALSGAVCSGS
jgi:hypothetical protein